MRPFFIKLALFVAMVSVAVWALDAWLDQQMKKQSGEDIGVWNRIYKGNIDADILVMGSSRASMHIDPAMVAIETGKSCFNIGMMGHNFFLEDARYRIYLQHNKAPKLIILSLDYESLQKRADLFKHTQFLPYLKDTILEKATKQYEGFSRYDYRLPLLKYVGEQELMFGLVKNVWNGSFANKRIVTGYFPNEKAWSKEVDAKLDTLKPFTIKNDSLSLAAFERFLEDCSERQIRLIFVNTPVHILGQAKALNGKEIMSIFKAIAHCHNISFYDYSADSMCRDKQYFNNSTHLNTFGSAYFTHKMLQDIKRDSLFRF